MNRPCRGRWFNWFESAQSRSPLCTMLGKPPGLARPSPVAGLEFKARRAHRIEPASGEKRLAAGTGTGRDPKWAAGGNLRSHLPSGCGTGWVPGQGVRDPSCGRVRPRASTPGAGDLRVSRRYVEVHRVAEVAALGAAVHGELVLIQVERLRGGGPQHPQRGREAAEGRERLPPAAPEPATGPDEHRRPPRQLRTRQRDPGWNSARVAVPRCLGARGAARLR